MYLSCINGGPVVKSVTINGTPVAAGSANEVVLLFDNLPQIANIEITTEGDWPAEQADSDYPVIPELQQIEKMCSQDSLTLPESLQKSYNILLKMQLELKKDSTAVFDFAFLNEAIESFVSCGVRPFINTGNGYYRAITPERKKGINNFYEQAALTMYSGFVKRMENYAANGNSQQKRMAVFLIKFRNRLKKQI